MQIQNQHVHVYYCRKNPIVRLFEFWTVLLVGMAIAGVIAYVG